MERKTDHEMEAPLADVAVMSIVPQDFPLFEMFFPLATATGSRFRV